MKTTALLPLFMFALPAIAQKSLPPLTDGAVINESATYRHDGPLRISGRVRIGRIDLDLRGPVTLASGAHLELEDVTIRVSDPPDSPNGTSALHCEGPVQISIRHSKMTTIGGAHPIWRLQGNVMVDDFQTMNSEFHLDHAEAQLTNFKIFELEISRASKAIGKHLHLVFLSTHTDDDERLEFSDIPADHPFSRNLRMGSQARADLTDTSAQLFLVYVHGKSEVTLNRIGRAQLAIFPICKGRLSLPHGVVGSAASPVVIPEANASDCPFRLRLADVNADTWDVYSGGDADLQLAHSTIDELTADGHAQVSIRDSEIYADWLSVAGTARMHVERSTVGAQRLALERPDLATSEVRVGGHAEATFDHVKFDCGIVAAGDAKVAVRNPVTPPKYIREADRASVSPERPIPVQKPGKEH